MTRLHPRHEVITVARKPPDGPVTDCVLEHGTGALNISECRIGTEERYNPPTSTNGDIYGDTTAGEPVEGTVKGRYPPNVIIDEYVADMIDEQSGITKSRGGNPKNLGNDRLDREASIGPTTGGLGDEGGASRFYPVIGRIDTSVKHNMTEINTEIRKGDCIDVMSEMEEESVHAVVTDPPYGLAFMGKTWDEFDPDEYEEFCQGWAEQAHRVLKPGGHLLAFSGTRTYHRLGTGIEKAGFEIRDKIDWIYGSGFPKALDVSKYIQKREGVEPVDINDPSVGFMNDDDDGWNDTHSHEIMPDPTGAAKEWEGWKTALKPAHEPVCVARKPTDGPVIDCVLEHGTGALNIDGSRIGSGTGEKKVREMSNMKGGNYAQGEEDYSDRDPVVRVTEDKGRYPANILLDEESAEMLDDQSGESKSQVNVGDPDRYGTSEGDATTFHYGRFDENNTYDDRGGASRFFYTSKAGKSERTHGGEVDNKHPTVKPVDLMEYLVKLVTAEGQIVLDPFAGTGTTCIAAYNLGRNSIGIEKDEEYAEIAEKRISANMSNPGEVGSEPDHIYNSVTEW